MAGKVMNLSGLRFGRLVAVEQRGYMGKGAAWLCRCDCGGEIVTRAHSLRSGARVSCGCRQAEIINEVRSGIRKPQLRHGHARKGVAYSGTYGSWCSMKERCTNHKSKNYPQYGGRGITVCHRWLDNFEAFIEDMGERPRGTSLDRIDPNGNYEPGNCRWSTAQVQGRNQRRGAHRIAEVLARFEHRDPGLIAELRRALLGA